MLLKESVKVLDTRKNLRFQSIFQASGNFQYTSLRVTSVGGLLPDVSYRQGGQRN